MTFRSSDAYSEIGRPSSDAWLPGKCCCTHQPLASELRQSASQEFAITPLHHRDGSIVLLQTRLSSSLPSFCTSRSVCSCAAPCTALPPFADLRRCPSPCQSMSTAFVAWTCMSQLQCNLDVIRIDCDGSRIHVMLKGLRVAAQSEDVSVRSSL